MTTVTPFARRLLAMTAERPYHLERTAAATIDDGLLWMRDWHGADGVCLWMQAGDTARRRAVHRWLWLRWLFRNEIRDRGLTDDG